MSDAVWASAIYGAIAGALGGLVGALITNFFKGPASRYVVIAAVAISIGLSQPVIRPLLEPHIGRFLPKAGASDDIEAAFDAEIAKANDPLFNAILAKEPDLKRQLVDEVRSVARTAPNPISARQSAFAASQAKVIGRLSHYMVRGRDEDLVTFSYALTEGLRKLSGSDPMFCHSYLYNPGALAAMNYEQIRAKFGSNQFHRQQAAGAKVVENAFADVPDYDRAVGAAGVAKAAAKLREVIPPEKLSLIGARVPNDVEEAKLACDGTIALYEAMQSDENAGTVLRHLFGGSAG